MVILLTVLAVDHVAGPLFSLSTHSWAPQRHGTTMFGVLEGPIKTADAATGTLHVASGFLGVRSSALDVTADTIIGVRGKLGGVGDLDRGQLVRVTYEVAADRLIARRVVLLNGEPILVSTAVPRSNVNDEPPREDPARREPVAPPRERERAAVAPVVIRAPVPDRVKRSGAVARPSSVPVPEAAPPASAPPVRGPAHDDTARSARPVETRPVETATPARSEAVALPPRADMTPAPTRPPAVPSLAPVPRPAVPAPTRPVVATPPATPSADAALPPRRGRDDAGAVIDWLLKSPPGRTHAAEAP